MFDVWGDNQSKKQNCNANKLYWKMADLTHTDDIAD